MVAKAVLYKDEIKQNLIDQLTGAVRWTQSVQSMIADGASKFTEVGPGKVLQGLVQNCSFSFQKTFGHGGQIRSSISLRRIFSAPIPS